MTKYPPGTHLRHKKTGEVAVVYCYTCRTVILWPVAAKPDPLTGIYINPDKAFPVPFARVARDYEEVPR